MLVVGSGRCARTGRVGASSTSGFAVVAAAIRTVLELDGVVLGDQRQFLQEGKIRIAPIVDHMTWVGPMAHEAKLVPGFPEPEL